MKAIVQNGYGSPDLLRLAEIDEPGVKDDDVLVRVHAAALNAGDCFSMRGSPWLVRPIVGFPKPKNHVLGWDIAGRVAAVGEQVQRFQSGDEVYGSCHGALAEFACAPQDSFAAKPAHLSFEQAAAVPTAALTALQGLRDAGKLRSGHKVLINGASGGVGTFAVQIAKALGAEVSGVCSSRNVEMVQSIGADQVIDYTKQDFAQSEQRYDLILDNVANRSLADLRRSLAPHGVIIPNSGHGGMSYVFKTFLLSLFMRQHGRLFVSNVNSRDLEFVSELVEAGKVTPVIDRTYPLSESAEALRYLEQGHAQGKVIITVA